MAFRTDRARRLSVLLSASGLVFPPVGCYYDEPAVSAGDGEDRHAVNFDERRDQAKALAQQDDDEAREQAAAAFGKLCEDGDAESCFFFGEAQERGVGMDKDPSSALETFGVACRLGHLVACTKVAVAVAAGAGTTADPRKARDMLEVNCRRDEVYACARLAVMEQQGEAGPIDLYLAAELWWRACDLDSTFCDEFGDVLRLGQWVPRDPGLASARYAESCDVDQSYGCRALGGMLLSGDTSGEPDRERALVAFTKGCNLGDRPACAYGRQLGQTEEPAVPTEGGETTRPTDVPGGAMATKPDTEKEREGGSAAPGPQ